MNMHRMILSLKVGDGVVVDHINGNGLDNRRINLRICKSSENTRNVTKRRDNKSGYKGVYYDNWNKKYRGSIRYNRQLYNLGYSDCKHLLAAKYNEKAKELFKSFAYLNKVKECECHSCVNYKRKKA